MTVILFIIIAALIAIFLIKYGFRKLGVSNKTTQIIIAIPLAIFITSLLYYLLVALVLFLIDGEHMDYF